MKKFKLAIKIVLVVVIGFWAVSSAVYIFWSRTPRFDTYEKQKEFGYSKHPAIMSNDIAVMLFLDIQTCPLKIKAWTGSM